MARPASPLRRMIMAQLEQAPADAATLAHRLGVAVEQTRMTLANLKRAGRAKDIGPHEGGRRRVVALREVSGADVGQVMLHWRRQ